MVVVVGVVVVVVVDVVVDVVGDVVVSVDDVVVKLPNNNICGVVRLSSVDAVVAVVVEDVSIASESYVAVIAVCIGVKKHSLSAVVVESVVVAVEIVVVVVVGESVVDVVVDAVVDVVVDVIVMNSSNGFPTVFNTTTPITAVRM